MNIYKENLIQGRSRTGTVSKQTVNSKTGGRRAMGRQRQGNGNYEQVDGRNPLM
jgi:hypothetical protein